MTEPATEFLSVRSPVDELVHKARTASDTTLCGVAKGEHWHGLLGDPCVPCANEYREFTGSGS